MKKSIKAISLTLILVLIFSITVFAAPGFAYDENTLEAFKNKWEKISTDETVISLSPGSKEGEIRFAWLSSNGDIGFISKLF